MPQATTGGPNAAARISLGPSTAARMGYGVERCSYDGLGG